MTCKDCIYRAMCYKHEHYGYGHEYNEKPCEMFKNKADFVEVSCKCRNCKHRRETMYGSYCLPVFGLKQITDLDAFCSYGERK